MNSIKTLQILTKLASDLDQAGLIAQADFVDYLIAQVSTGLRPVGEAYQKDGKYYRKFEDPSKGLVIKEVDSAGRLIAPPASNPAAPTPTEPEPWFWEKAWDAINPWSGLVDGLGSNPEAAIEEQKKSEVPHIKQIHKPE